MPQHISFTIKLRSTVDEGRDAYEIEITAEIVVVEDGARLRHAERVNRRGGADVCRRSDVRAQDGQTGSQREQYGPKQAGWPRAEAHGTNLLCCDFRKLLGQWLSEDHRSQHAQQIGVTHL